MDQRSHLGLVTALHGDQAEVHFLRPTSKAMLAGVQLPASALQPAVFRQDDVSSLPPGSRVLARLQGPADGGVWHECQIVDFAAGGRRVTVRSSANGLTATLPLAEVAAAHGAVSDGAEADAESENDADAVTEDEEDLDDVETHRNAHAAVAAPVSGQQDTEEEETPSPEAVERLQAALQDDAQAVRRAVQTGSWQGAVLAAFEQHTRGIGSKLLAAMGFVAGRGLGRDGEGIVAPVDVQVRACQRPTQQAIAVASAWDCASESASLTIVVQPSVRSDIVLASVGPLVTWYILELMMQIRELKHHLLRSRGGRALAWGWCQSTACGAELARSGAAASVRGEESMRRRRARRRSASVTSEMHART